MPAILVTTESAIVVLPRSLLNGSLPRWATSVDLAPSPADDWLEEGCFSVSVSLMG